MRIHIGTSGFSYTAWKGSFYPKDLPAARMLAYYAERLGTVEINNTFYRMPRVETLRQWGSEVPEGFRFALKCPRRVTHERRLLDAGEPTLQFLDIAGQLGSRLGPVLFQLPPFQRRDTERLRAFLGLLPPGCKAALEVRHDSWFSDDVFATLRERGAALCVAESEDLATPLEATASWGYLRLRRQDYGDAELTAWAERIRAQPWEEAFVYFKHEDEGRGPALAARLREILPG